MSDAFVGEIRAFALNFAPLGWAMCDGQLLPIGQNTALFSVLGTTYGGNGTTTFALPDLQGRAVLGPGKGPGLSLRNRGGTGGAETVTLSETESPGHSHSLQAATSAAVTPVPSSTSVLAAAPVYRSGAATNEMVVMADSGLVSVGSDGPHNNMQPYLTLNFAICLAGIYPQR